MAKTLQTPIINNIAPFDPTESYTVSFSYSDNASVSIGYLRGYFKRFFTADS